MAGKLAKETYKKHENNAQCMRIWVAKFFLKNSFIKRPMFRLTIPFKVVTCPSPLEYK
jgi:hypothetical protein